jgi:indolepyruvate decarboxylase
MPVASDMGDCLFTALDFRNTDLVAPGYFATMGFGVPAAFGLQVVTDERPLVVVGDGAFQMTGWELLNCQRYGWDPIVLVFNNCSWEMLRAFQPESRFSDLVEIPFAEIAPSLGGEGYRVRTRQELKVALERAAETRGRFQLIEIMMSRGTQSPTLARFVNGFKQMRQASPGAPDQRPEGIANLNRDSQRIHLDTDTQYRIVLKVT